MDRDEPLWQGESWFCFVDFSKWHPMLHSQLAHDPEINQRKVAVNLTLAAHCGIHIFHDSALSVFGKGKRHLPCPDFKGQVIVGQLTLKSAQVVLGQFVTVGLHKRNLLIHLASARLAEENAFDCFGEVAATQIRMDAGQDDISGAQAVQGEVVASLMRSDQMDDFFGSVGRQADVDSRVVGIVSVDVRQQRIGNGRDGVVEANEVNGHFCVLFPAETRC